jgi:hypothetical protein
MRILKRILGHFVVAGFIAIALPAQNPSSHGAQIGQEHALARHLQDDEEFRTPLRELIEHGKKVFCANWTDQDGAGRPLTKGTGKPVSDPNTPLKGARGWNRLSGPDANSCAGCHNEPYGIPGGGGDLATGVFVLGQRFDFATLDPKDKVPTRGSVDERGRPVTLENLANFRSTTGMFGAGYLEMMAREITEDLQAIRDSMKRGETRPLVSKGISFGVLTRRMDNTWDVSGIVGLPRASILAPTPQSPPNLIVRPWHQAGNVVSLREFTNNAFNQHHGMQSTERFGVDRDADGDGIMNELTRADITAASIFQAVMQVPGQVIPNDPEVEQAVANGEKVFSRIGCATCHVPSLPLSRRNWTYTEPNPYNPPTNLRAGQTEVLKIYLNDPSLPQPRLKPATPDAQWLMVPAFTDFKLHDISDPADPYYEPLDMNQPVWADRFTSGNRKFLTKRLWGSANEPPYFHHGLFTTLRASVLGHAGEALQSRKAFEALPEYDKDSLIEFLKSLQVLPPGTRDLIVDENFKPKTWSGARHGTPARLSQSVQR